LQTVYTLACFDLARGSFKKGFDEISRAFSVVRSAETGEGDNASQHEMFASLIASDASFRT
jgi:hypothetical protein